MADYTRTAKKLLYNHGCRFVKYGKGDHETWYSPITDQKFTIDGTIKKRTSANQYLKLAGIKQKV